MESLPITLLRMIDSYLEMIDHLALTEVCRKTNRLKIKYSDDWKSYKNRDHPCDLRFLKYLIRYKKFNDMRFLYSGNIECIKWFISSSVNLNWNKGLYYASLHGNVEIANLLIQKGADDWNEGFCGACLGGNIEMMKLMIQKGATSCEWCDGKNHQF